MSDLTGGNERSSANREHTRPTVRGHLRDIVAIAGFVGIAYTVLRYHESREPNRGKPIAHGRR